MGRLPSSPRRSTILAAAILAGAASGCGLSGPTPAPPPPVTTAPKPEPKDVTTSPHLLLRIGERRLYFLDDDPATPIESFPIAVGRPGRDTETPTGRFKVEEMVVDPDFLKVDRTTLPPKVIKRIPPGPDNPLGKRWIGIVLGPGWTVGIHGTPKPELLGQAVSGGCIRMRNEDVVRIFDRVELGTTVIVEQ